MNFLLNRQHLQFFPLLNPKKEKKMFLKDVIQEMFPHRDKFLKFIRSLPLDLILLLQGA